MNVLGVIPARYDSTRFPGKPLVMIDGKSMIRRVYEQAKKALKEVVVATDDIRIFEEVESFGGLAVLTSKSHRSGTDRSYEALNMLKEEGKYFDVLLNIQGDEPFIDPKQIKLLVSAFEENSTQIATLYKAISNSEELFDENIPKLILNTKSEAIYFSRNPIPFVRNFPKEKWLENASFYKHIGIYAYRVDVLAEITKLNSSKLELAESLEQLRWIENGYKIKAIETDIETISIDLESDILKLKQSGLIP